MSTGDIISRKVRIRPPTLRVLNQQAIEESKPTSSIFQITNSLFISGYESAKNHELLKSFSITHILNLAGESKCPNQFSSSFTYSSLKMPDNPKIDILFFIYFAVEVIQQALSKNGKILVHCVKGTSRAAAVVLAYFILQGFSESEAYTHLLAAQPNIDPNFGFVCQLKELGKFKEDFKSFNYSSRYDMFISSEEESQCCIQLRPLECSLTISPQATDQEKNRALDSVRLWEKFNNAKAEVIYVI
jgi:protein-tyrosine phosphatase